MIQMWKALQVQKVGMMRETQGGGDMALRIVIFIFIFCAPWAQGGPRSDIGDLCRRWWEGPSDPSVGQGPGRWERLPPTGTRSREGKAVSYA